VRMVAVLGIALGGVALAETPQLKFQRFTSAAGRVTAELPGTPSEETESSGGTKRDNFFVKASATGEGETSYAALDPNLLQGKEPLKLLKALRDGYRQGVKFEGTRELSLGKEKYPGLEYRFQDRNVFQNRDVYYRERLFLVGNRVYTQSVAAMGDKDFP